MVKVKKKKHDCISQLKLGISFIKTFQSSGWEEADLRVARPLRSSDVTVDPSLYGYAKVRSFRIRS